MLTLCSRMSLILLPFKESVVVKLCEDKVSGRMKVVFKRNCISRIGVFCEMEDVSWFLGCIVHGKSISTK